MAENLEQFREWLMKQTIHLGRASEIKKTRFVEEALKQVQLSIANPVTTIQTKKPIVPDKRIAVSPEYLERTSGGKAGVTMMTKEESMKGDPDCGQHDQLDKL